MSYGGKGFQLVMEVCVNNPGANGNTYPCQQLPVQSVGVTVVDTTAVSPGIV